MRPTLTDPWLVTAEMPRTKRLAELLPRMVVARMKMTARIYLEDCNRAEKDPHRV